MYIVQVNVEKFQFRFSENQTIHNFENCPVSFL